MTQRLRLYYKNVTDEAIGEEHGIAREELDHHKDQVARVVADLNRQGKNGELPYRKLPYDTAMHDQARRLADELSPSCRNFVVLGIGGSALGNIALQTALNKPFYNLMPPEQRGGPRLFVMDNVDPVEFEAMLELVKPELEDTIFNVISKSGETAETASQFLIVRHLLLQRFGKKGLAKHLVATTDPAGGTLRRVADEDGLRTLQVPPGVGGRFSVLSHVGLLSAAVCGIDTEQLLAGAVDMDKRVSETDLFANPAAMYGLIQLLFYQRNKPLSVMFPYSHQLKDLTDWYRQLWAESLGKERTFDGKTMRIGPTPIKSLGTTDQHSQVQLYREGPNDKVFTFLSVEHFDDPCPIPPELAEEPGFKYLGDKTLAELMRAEKVGTEYALVKSRRPCLTITFPKVNPYTVGQFIYMLEVATSIVGTLFNINPYDQPAVELGKKATFALMGREGHEELHEELKPYAEIDADYVV